MKSEKGIKSENRDPITNAPGAHPVGTGIGAAGAGAAGTAIGAAVGPVGAIVGAAVGSVVGGLIGKGVAEAIDPTAEEAYWRDNYKDRDYYNSEYSFDDDYLPAYKYGWEARTRHNVNNFDEVEGPLETEWRTARVKSRLDWDQARPAVRDAWGRINPPREEVPADDHFDTAPTSGRQISR